MPLATTTRLLAPVSALAGTSKLVDTTFVPVATAHSAGIVGASIDDVLARVIGNAHQPVTAVHLRIVAVSRAVGQAIKLRARDFVGITTSDGARSSRDRRRPRLLIRSLGRVNLGIDSCAIRQACRGFGR